ncbi:MAG: FAD-dependent oxidoreductase [Hyphomicrobiales bacterium]
MLGVALPLINVRQEKIAFDDHLKAIPRTMPFAIDLDGQSLRWEQDERALLVENDEFSWMADEFPGGIHCRPDGGTQGTWVRLGWAYNRTPEEPAPDPELSPYFLDIVLRGASRLNPALAAYIGKLPRKHTHYGGYYTMTEENWPLIGPMGELDGAYMVAGMSGFGTMAACGVGKLCADWISGAPLPNYADALSVKRYDDLALMAELEAGNKGVP